MTMNIQKRSDTSVETRPEQPRRDVVPVATITEQGDAYLLDVLLPGVAESEITLTTEDRSLLVEALNHVEHPEGCELIRAEFPEVRYHGLYELPEHVDATGIKAELKNGVLRVRLPKREDVKPRKIEVKAS